MRGHEVEGFQHREAVLRVAIVGDMGTFGVGVGAEFLDRGDLVPFPYHRVELELERGVLQGPVPATAVRSESCQLLDRIFGVATRSGSCRASGFCGGRSGEPTPRFTAARSLRPRSDRRGGRLRAGCSQAVYAVNRTWWRPGECCD